jgi:hypothetical protein
MLPHSAPSDPGHAQANIAVNDIGEAVLSDIGVFRVALDDSNPVAVVAGLIEANAVRWMAPELLDPHAANPRLTKETDAYALSMVAIEVRMYFLHLRRVPKHHESSTLEALRSAK